MKIINCFLILFSVFYVEKYAAADCKEPDNLMDSILLQCQDSIRYKNILINWQSFVIEEIVSQNGSSDGQAISLGIEFKDQETDEIWHLLLPVPYKEFIKNQPDKVSYNFEGYSINLIDADFENDRNTFIVLSVQNATDISASYFIDNKQVNEKDFNNFLKLLKEIPGTWFCGETMHGGMVGYDAVDENGNFYHYRSEIENGISITTLASKPSLNF